MPRMTDTEEGFVERESSIEEAENCDINLNFTCSFPGGVVEDRTDEETKISPEEFSNLSMDCSEEWILPEDILKAKSKSSNPPSELNQIDTAFEFFDKVSYAEALLSFEDECFEVCDPNMIMVNIKASDSDDSLGGTELKRTSDERKKYFINLEKSIQTIKSVERFFTKRNSKLTEEVLKKCSNQSAESLDVQSQALSIVDYESVVSRNSASGMNTSKTVIEQSTSSAETSEDQNRIEASKNLGGSPNEKTFQSVEVLVYLDYITSIVNDVESMNNNLTKIASSLLKSQHTLQELINIVYEYLFKLQYLPSTVILADNEYAVGKKNFNVEIFGQGIFENLKSTKKELNGTFREFIGFRKDFRYVSRKVCLVPFESTLDHELQSTLDKTAGIYNKVCRVFKKREHTEIIERRINSETLSVLLRVKEFEDYLIILNESQSRERLV